jgi:hypothetical protein
MSPSVSTECDEYDDFWKDDEPEPEARGRHAAKPRHVRPATVLAALAGGVGLALAAAAVFDWLPASNLPTAPRLAAAGADRIGGAQTGRPAGTQSAQSSRPAPTPTPTHKKAAPHKEAAPRRKAAPHKRAAPHRRAAPAPTPPPAPPGPVELSLAPYFNNLGVVSARDQNAGNIDGGGFSFSMWALAARGAWPGATVTFHGVPFTWPDVAAGRPDNVVASGQTLRVRGAGRTLAFLVTAGWGPATGTAKVVYASGPVQKFTLSSPDWWLECSRTTPGEVLKTPYRYPGNGQPGSFTGCLFYASVRLRAGRPVAEIILPRISGPVPRGGKASLHIFAITIH